MKKIVITLIILGVLVVGCAIYFKSPTVEDVAYSAYKDKIKNHLIITVNTKSRLFEGREGFLSFKRDHYHFCFATKGKIYTEQDIMDITIFGTKEMKIKPKQAIVNIEDNHSGGIVVTVNINDDRIPKLINGRYLLKVAEDSTNSIWYKMK